MWWTVATAFGEEPVGDLRDAELLDPGPRQFGERPPAAGPRRALEREAEAALLWTRAGAAVDPTTLLARRERLLSSSVRVRTAALARGESAVERVALACVLEDLQRPDEAVEHWSRALALEADGPYAPRAHLALADALLRRGDPGGALPHLVGASADPAAGPYASWRAGWTAWSLGRLEEAATWFVAAAGGRDALVAEDARRDALALAPALDPSAADALIARVCGAAPGCSGD